MRTKSKGVRGNNKISNTLNKKVDGRFGKKQKSRFVIVVFLILFMVITYIAVDMLGVKTGVLFSLGGAIALVISSYLRKQTDEITQKRNWRAFDKDE